MCAITSNVLGQGLLVYWFICLYLKGCFLLGVLWIINDSFSWTIHGKVQLLAWKMTVLQPKIIFSDSGSCQLWGLPGVRGELHSQPVIWADQQRLADQWTRYGSQISLTWQNITATATYILIFTLGSGRSTHAETQTRIRGITLETALRQNQARHDSQSSNVSGYSNVFRNSQFKNKIMCASQMDKNSKIEIIFTL